jgi:hypothetical protein
MEQEFLRVLEQSGRCEYEWLQPLKDHFRESGCLLRQHDDLIRDPLNDFQRISKKYLNSVKIVKSSATTAQHDIMSEGESYYIACYASVK